MAGSRGRALRGLAVRAAWALIVLGAAALQVQATDITELKVSEEAGVYRIKMVTVVEAPADYVYRVLTDYVHIHRLNPSITRSGILPSPRNGAVRVMTRVRDCIFVFCIEVDRVEDVFEVPPYDVQTVIVPSLCDFRSGRAHWHIEEMNERSRIVYEGQMEPDFPRIPVIGPSVIKQRLREELVSSLKRIECVARIMEKLDWNPHLPAAMVDVEALCGQTCDSPAGRCPP